MPVPASSTKGASTPGMSSWMQEVWPPYRSVVLDATG
jgi:hypothetical protein